MKSLRWVALCLEGILEVSIYPRAGKQLVRHTRPRDRFVKLLVRVNNCTWYTSASEVMRMSFFKIIV